MKNWLIKVLCRIGIHTYVHLDGDANREFLRSCKNCKKTEWRV